MIRIYSVGVWNDKMIKLLAKSLLLEFTPLEFETSTKYALKEGQKKLEFTPLEFETRALLWVCFATLD